jgi:hypothetical protein
MLLKIITKIGGTVFLLPPVEFLELIFGHLVFKSTPDYSAPPKPTAAGQRLSLNFFSVAQRNPI